MLERVWRRGNPPTLSVGRYIGTATVENSMEHGFAPFEKKAQWATSSVLCFKVTH